MLLKALYPTPILNTCDFSSVFGSSLPFDDQGLVRELEMIAYPGMIFQKIADHTNGIIEVTASFYPSKTRLFIDQRFVIEACESRSPLVTCPTRENVQQNLLSMLGSSYIWGGNYSKGIASLLEFYPPQKKLSEMEKKSWIFKGVDCSGLLFEATQGFTPRNTSWIAGFGNSVTPKEIIPLDAIIYREESGGYHIVIVLDEKRTIESRGDQGVIICDLPNRLEEIGRLYAKNWMHDSKTFTIRRYI